MLAVLLFISFSISSGFCSGGGSFTGAVAVSCLFVSCLSVSCLFVSCLFVSCLSFSRSSFNREIVNKIPLSLFFNIDEKVITSAYKEVIIPFIYVSVLTFSVISIKGK